MDKLLDYQKTNLLAVRIDFDGETLRTDAKFSLRKQEDGFFTPAIHLIRYKPDLERPYFGVEFTKEDRENLLKSGNLGRIVETEFRDGEKTPVLLSLDKQTNELVAYRAEWLRVPDIYKGVELSDDQKQQLGEGKKVHIEDMISQEGKKFSADVQFNADKRFFKLIFDNNKSQKEGTHQSESNAVRIPNKILGVDLTDRQQSDLRDGKTIYLTGMKNKEGEDFKAYIKVNAEKGKLDFFKYNPDKKQEQKTASKEDREAKQTKGRKM